MVYKSLSVQPYPERNPYVESRGCVYSTRTDVVTFNAAIEVVVASFTFTEAGEWRILYAVDTIILAFRTHRQRTVGTLWRPVVIPVTVTL